MPFLTLEEFEVPIFNSEYSVLIVIGEKDRALGYAKHYLTIVEDDDVKDKRGCCWMEHMKKPLIWVGLERNTNHFYSTLAHEAVHAVQHIFDEIGETHSKEIFAHCVGAIVAYIEEK